MAGLRIESPLTPEQEELISRIIGAATEVHSHLGPGFMEKIYEKALCRELNLCNIPFECQKAINVSYKDIQITGQQLDLIVAGEVIVELKAVDHLSAIHEAQLMSYLKTTGIKIGLLINFNVKLLKDGGIRRILR
jgi:GxxExxY protein